jgi:protein SCO1/2
MQTERTVNIILTALGLLIGAVLVLYFSTTTAEFGKKPATSLDQLGGDFTVQSAQGPVQLSDFRGQVVVMYFGFLNCPDVCPNSMLTMASALKKLPDDQQSQVQVMMISVDPQRDDLGQLESFATYYNQRFIGATAPPEELNRIAEQYAAYFEVRPAARDDDYEVEHVSRYYVIGPDGNLQDAMRHSTTANELAARISHIVGQSPTSKPS